MNADTAAYTASLAAENERLREALSELVSFCDDPQGSEKGESLVCGLVRLLPACRAALSAAKEQQP
jgi:hypothetical protein